MRYQTEIHVSTDRYVCLQLPSYFPEGKATVTVHVELEDPLAAEALAGDESDRQDIEWWEEFDEGVGRRP
jgi:hypothetical protein